jgi:hypothetical protein
VEWRRIASSKGKNLPFHARVARVTKAAAVLAASLLVGCPSAHPEPQSLDPCQGKLQLAAQRVEQMNAARSIPPGHELPDEARKIIVVEQSCDTDVRTCSDLKGLRRVDRFSGATWDEAFDTHRYRKAHHGDQLLQAAWEARDRAIEDASTCVKSKCRVREAALRKARGGLEPREATAHEKLAAERAALDCMKPLFDFADWAGLERVVN